MLLFVIRKQSEYYIIDNNNKMDSIMTILINVIIIYAQYVIEQKSLYNDSIFNAITEKQFEP